VSGILGVLHLDGRSVEQELLSVLTEAMEFRGPDGSSTWRDGPIGLANAALDVSPEDEGARQPCSLDGNTWITSDLRLDGRVELSRELEARGRAGSEGCTDAELALHAYATWGPAMVEHLLGDFAFAIWDRRERMLFCGRDPFGIKPFYYALLGETVVFANTVDSIRAHRDVSSDLDELAIAEFLLFNFNGQQDRTAFADIKKLPPAHTITWKSGVAPARRRYWNLSVSELTRYREGQEYIDHFLDLFSHAVTDRLRCDRASVLMSGGLDSTSVAWMASRAVPDLDAFTFGYDHLIVDEEYGFSAAVGAALGIDVHFLGLDEDRPEHLWDPDVAASRAVSPEPVDLPVTGRISHLLRQLAPDRRVCLTGQGGDPLLHLSRRDFTEHFRRRRLGVLVEVAMYWRSHGMLPRVGMRTSIKRRLQAVSGDELPVYPPWLEPGLEARLRLKDRWQEELARLVDAGAWRGDPDDPGPIKIRPWAHDDLTAPVWTAVFESYDPGVTRFAAEVRHPFFDLRLVEFLLSVPPLPWLVDKELLRVAMKDRLPDNVRDRPKAPLGGYPVHERMAREPRLDLERFVEAAGIDRFIDLKGFLTIAQRPQRLRPSEYGLITRPLGLAVWLQKLARSGVN
jgi:asparagine synthase (glutamine-hydrolysing)